MKNIGLQTLIGLGLLWSFSLTAASIQRDVEVSHQGCYYFSFMGGNIKVSFPPKLAKPQLTMAMKSSPSSEQQIPVLETRNLDSGCVLTTWKPSLDQKNTMKGADIDLYLPATAKEFQIVNLSGSIRGAGGPAGAQGVVNIDQGSIFWGDSQLDYMEIRQTTGSITLNNHRSPFFITGEKSKVSIRNYQLPEGLQGQEARIELKHGKVDLQNINGALTVKTQTAPVIAQRTQTPMRIETDTGSIRVRQIEAPVNLASRTGNIQTRLRSNIKGTSTVKSVKGNIDLLLNPKLDAAVEVDQVSMPVESDFEGKAKGGKRVFTLNAQTHKIMARSPDGAITIKKF